MIRTGSSPSSSRASAAWSDQPCRAPLGSEQVRQLSGCFVAERHKISGLTPRGRFFGAPGRHHLADDGWQHSRRVFPADQVKALERLVDEVERVSGVGEHPLGLGREQDISEHRRRKTGCNRRKQGALGRLAMANVVQRCSQRLSAAGSGRLPSGARSRRGASPSQSAATRRAPWNRAR